MSHIREREARWPAALLALTCLAAAACSGRASHHADGQRANTGGGTPTAEGEGREEPPRLYSVIVKGKTGFIDATGKVIIPPRFYSSSDFSEGLALVSVGGKKGFIDRTGRLVIEAVYDVAYPFSEGLARVTSGGKNGYIDKTGKTVVEPQYGDAGDFSGGLAPVQLNRRWGYIDKAGRVAIKPQFDRADEFAGDLALVSVGWVDADVPQTGIKNGYIDKTGKYVWPPTN